MWFGGVIGAPVAEPVTLEKAREQCRIVSTDTDHDGSLAIYIASARAHCEERCGQLFAVREVVRDCSSFADFARLPIAPVNSITSIKYMDFDNAEQTLAASVYALQADGLDAAIELKAGQVWPAIYPNSRIEVTMNAGAVPDGDVLHAMLLFVDHSFNERAWALVDDWTTLDTLLCNHIWYS